MRFILFYYFYSAACRAIFPSPIRFPVLLLVFVFWLLFVLSVVLFFVSSAGAVVNRGSRGWEYPRFADVVAGAYLPD